jgi:hypothetical protein
MYAVFVLSGIDLMKSLPRRGIQPNADTYLAALRTCRNQAGKAEIGLSFFTKMKRSGIPASPVAYRFVLFDFILGGVYTAVFRACS